MSMAILMCSVRDVSTPICGEACLTAVTKGMLHRTAYQHLHAMASRSTTIRG